jgi:hypothetical protein
VSDESLVDSLEGTVVWKYNSMACPQIIARANRREIEEMDEEEVEAEIKRAGRAIAENLLDAWSG